MKYLIFLNCERLHPNPYLFITLRQLKIIFLEEQWTPLSSAIAVARQRVPVAQGGVSVQNV